MASEPQQLDALKVDVTALRRRKQDRHVVETTLDVDWLATVLQETDAEPRDPGHVSLTLHLPTEGAVIATGRLQLHFEVPCGRCLEPASVEGDAEISATFVVGSDLPGPSGQQGDDDDEPGLGLSADDLDTWTFDGRVLHLDPMLIEQIRVAYPMRALCSRGEACRGLCSQCGANLNEPASPPSRCPSCGAAVGPAVGSAMGSGPGEAADGAGPDERENPFAAALGRLKLDD